MTENLMDFLNSPKRLRAEVKRLKQFSQGLWELATGMTPGYSGMPGGGGQEGPKSSWTALADSRQALDEKVDELLEKVDKVQRFIERIENPEQRIVLLYRYVNGLSWPEVEKNMTGEYSYSIRQIFNIHGRGLESARKLWEETET